jgi:DNA-binding transcriptional regulator YiaG
MKTKKLNNYIYEGLGFPVTLKSVDMIKVDNEWHPKVDVLKVSEEIIKLLPFQKERLTGSQIHFIRTYFSMSLRQFATGVVKESHMAVSKWEKFQEKPTNMDSNTEIMLRLYIFEKTSINTAKDKREFFSKYQIIREAPLLKTSPEVYLDAA